MISKIGKNETISFAIEETKKETIDVKLVQSQLQKEMNKITAKSYPCIMFFGALFLQRLLEDMKHSRITKKKLPEKVSLGGNSFINVLTFWTQICVWV